MLPQILGRKTPKEDQVDSSDLDADDVDETAVRGAVAGETTSTPAVSALEDQLSQTHGDGETPKKEGQHPATMYPEDWGSKFECMGELVVERSAEAGDVVKVYQTLNDRLKAEIFYVNPTYRGTSIVCGITDAALFMASLPGMPRVSAWTLTHK